MTRFYFRIYQCGDEDGSTVWVDANSREDAREKVLREYHSIDDLFIIKSEKL